jgi:hypothetical protein
MVHRVQRCVLIRGPSPEVTGPPRPGACCLLPAAPRHTEQQAYLQAIVDFPRKFADFRVRPCAKAAKRLATGQELGLPLSAVRRFFGR